jgi:hypothetical protein
MSMQPLEIRISRLEGIYEQIDKRIGDLTTIINGRFSQVDSGFARVDARIDALDQKLDRKFDGLQWRMTSLILATWITTIVAVLFKH